MRLTKVVPLSLTLPSLESIVFCTTTPSSCSTNVPAADPETGKLHRFNPRAPSLSRRDGFRRAMGECGIVQYQCCILLADSVFRTNHQLVDPARPSRRCSHSLRTMGPSATRQVFVFSWFSVTRSLVSAEGPLSTIFSSFIVRFSKRVYTPTTPDGKQAADTKQRLNKESLCHPSK